ncbi:hypothetical protein Dda_7027 [Drechslerella dactyloides]|uniref:Uncharacterized protein n=1 Tax=Drechslerella dactyloides TaxID=74499 RepID=A0AAD6NH94_DREDA|nr:hypothetical protein Dda_7027 [Drechslerella dactyloides]
MPIPVGISNAVMANPLRPMPTSHLSTARAIPAITPAAAQQTKYVENMLFNQALQTLIRAENANRGPFHPRYIQPINVVGTRFVLPNPHPAYPNLTPRTKLPSFQNKFRMLRGTNAQLRPVAYWMDVLAFYGYVAANPQIVALVATNAPEWEWAQMYGNSICNMDWTALQWQRT